MVQLVFYTLAAFGLAYVIGHSIATKAIREGLFTLGAPLPPLRWLVWLVECPACFGFWIGWFTGLWFAWESPLGRQLLAAFAIACYTAGTNFVLGKLTGLMQPEVKD